MPSWWLRQVQADLRAISGERRANAVLHLAGSSNCDPAAVHGCSAGLVRKGVTEMEAQLKPDSHVWTFFRKVDL